MEKNNLNKVFYKQKNSKGFSYQGYSDGLLHYSKSIHIYNKRFKAIKPVKGGVLFEDILEENPIKRKKGVFKSNSELATLSRSTEYQNVSCTEKQLLNGDLEFLV